MELWKLCQIVLTLDTVWLDSAALGRRSLVKELLKDTRDTPLHKIARAANLLQHVGLIGLVFAGVHHSFFSG